MALASGIITVAQENRFQLALDHGGTRLFVVSRHAPIDPQQLDALQRSQERVVVRYRAAAGVLADEAEAIENAK